MFAVWPIYYGSKRPGVPELDFAGTVAQAGGGVQAGDRVCGSVFAQM
jgi:NADPH:quinone reductase-like Zn-dependent oxidoreductase